MTREVRLGRKDKSEVRLGRNNLGSYRNRLAQVGLRPTAWAKGFSKFEEAICPSRTSPRCLSEQNPRSFEAVFNCDQHFIN